MLLGLEEDVSVDTWLKTRAGMGEVLAELADVASEIDDQLDVGSAQSRLIRYFLCHLGKPVTKNQLAAVGGISEWARRVRELREDHGWVIHTALTQPGLAVGEYVLALDRPQPRVAEIWLVARELRRLQTLGGTVTSQWRVLEFLKRISPSPATRDQIVHVAGSDAAADAALEWIGSEGWALSTVPAHDAIAPGGTRLESISREM
jgi:hypothetical protein